jgi:hypothetical protein
MCRLNAGTLRRSFSRSRSSGELRFAQIGDAALGHWPPCFCDRRKLLHEKGNKQSPLETPVQRLRNTRLVEEICAWTEATPPFHL